MHGQIRILWLSLLLLGMPAGVLAGAPLWDHAVSSEVGGLTMTPDGSYVLVSGERLRYLAGDGTQLWDGISAPYADCAADGSTVARAKGYEVTLFSRDGAVLWQASLDSECAALALSSDGKRLAVADTVGEVWFYDGDGVLKATVDIRGDPDDEEYDAFTRVYGIAFSEKGDRAAVVSSHGLFCYTGTGKKLWAHEGVLEGGTAVAVSGSGEEIAVASDAGVRLYNQTGDLLWEEKSRRPITALAISSDGSRVFAGSQDNLLVCVGRAGERLWEYTADGWVRGIAVSENGSRLLAGSMDRQAYLFDGEGHLLGTSLLDGWVNHVAITADGSVGVAASPHQVVRFSTAALPETAVSPAVPTTVTQAPTTAQPGPTVSPAVPATVTQAPTPGDEEGGPGLPLLLLGLLVGGAVLGGAWYRHLKGRRRDHALEVLASAPRVETPEEPPALPEPWEVALKEGETREAAKILSKEMTALIEEKTGKKICFTEDALDACPEHRESLAAFFAMANALGYAPKVPEQGEVEVLVEVYRYLARQI